MSEGGMMIGIMDKEVAKNIFWGAFTLGFVVGCLFTVIFSAVKMAVGQQLPDPSKLAPPIESFAIIVGAWPNAAVSIRANGEVVYGEGVTLDEASKQFWEAVGKQMSQACPVVK
jgi:hypothetical protein